MSPPPTDCGNFSRRSRSKTQRDGHMPAGQRNGTFTCQDEKTLCCINWQAKRLYGPIWVPTPCAQQHHAFKEARGGEPRSAAPSQDLTTGSRAAPRYLTNQATYTGAAIMRAPVDGGSLPPAQTPTPLCCQRLSGPSWHAIWPRLGPETHHSHPGYCTQNQHKCPSKSHSDASSETGVLFSPRCLKCLTSVTCTPPSPTGEELPYWLFVWFTLSLLPQPPAPSSRWRHRVF